MSNKTERTAWNLTKIAAELGCKPSDRNCTVLFEMARDAKLAMIDGEPYGIDHVVFVPAKLWAERHERAMEYARLTGEEYDTSWRAKTVSHWNDMAAIHQF